MIDGQTDGRTDGQTELRWLRRAIAVPAVARKHWYTRKLQISMVSKISKDKNMLYYETLMMNLVQKYTILLILVPEYFYCIGLV